jgi:hypothetical protein
VGLWRCRLRSSAVPISAVELAGGTYVGEVRPERQAQPVAAAIRSSLRFSRAMTWVFGFLGLAARLSDHVESVRDAEEQIGHRAEQTRNVSVALAVLELFRSVARLLSPFHHKPIY